MCHFEVEEAVENKTQYCTASYPVTKQGIKEANTKIRQEVDEPVARKMGISYMYLKCD